MVSRPRNDLRCFLCSNIGCDIGCNIGSKNMRSKIGSKIGSRNCIPRKGLGRGPGIGAGIGLGIVSRYCRVPKGGKVTKKAVLLRLEVVFVFVVQPR